MSRKLDSDGNVYKFRKFFLLVLVFRFLDEGEK